ncbi:MAG: phasin family protein [Candidatus Binatia bacterium]
MKMAATKAKNATFASFRQVQDSIRSLQKEGEKLASRVQKEVLNLVSKDQRKALERVLDQATRIRKDLQKRAERAMKEIETRAEKLFKRIEARAEQGIDPVIRRLNLPSRQDVESLGKRLSMLEKKVEEIATHRAA